MATTRRESAVRFKMSCDFVIETPPPSPDITTQLARIELNESLSEVEASQDHAPGLDDSFNEATASTAQAAAEDQDQGLVTPTKGLPPRRETSTRSIAKPINPFVNITSRDIFSRSTLVHAINSMSRRRRSQNFQIDPASTGDPSAKAAINFHLTKSVFKLGEDVVGRFDFGPSRVPCYQVSATGKDSCAVGFIRAGYQKAR